MDATTNDGKFFKPMLSPSMMEPTTSRSAFFISLFLENLFNNDSRPTVNVWLDAVLYVAQLIVKLL